MSLPEVAIWHDVECGGYAGDVDLWRALAADLPGPVLDLGAGTGRVSLDLAARGARVVALDVRGELLGVLAGRAAERGLEIDTVAADCREPLASLAARFPLVIAPMQLFHLLPDDEDRRAALSAQRSHVVPGGRLVVVLLGTGEIEVGEPVGMLPDVRERDDWVYASTPVEVSADEDGIMVRRRRERVSPAGELRVSEDRIRLHRLDCDLIEREARDCGWVPVRRTPIAPTAEHVGSIAVELEAPGG